MEKSNNEEQTIEIMYNSIHGGFGFSNKAIKMYCEKKGIEYIPQTDEDYNRRIGYSILRHDKVMISIIKEIGKEANSEYSNIKLEKIPEKYLEYYEIEKYDGLESINENSLHCELELQINEFEKENQELKKQIEELKKQIEELKKQN